MTAGFQQQIYEFLMESQFFSAEDMRRQQMHQLEALLRFARENVAFYKTRLNAVFNRDGTFDFSRWAEVPLLMRRDLLIYREAMLAPTVPTGHGPCEDFQGSGTTGQSITIRHNRLSGIASTAAMFRCWDWHGFDYSQNYFEWFGKTQEDARWPDGRHRVGWGPPGYSGIKGTYCALHRLEPVERAFAFMKRFNARYAASRPHALFELAQYAESEKIHYPMQGLTGFGANITDTIREECRRIFGKPVLSLYAAKETYNIAHECPAGRHHINAELMLVEVLDENDAPCPPGKQGRIVITTFYNTAQPLVRYELGDEVTLGEGCNCGCKLPVIAELNGRSVHLFRLPGGRKMALRLPADLKKSFGALEWQVAQVALEAVEIRYLKQREARPEELAAITTVIRTQMTANTAVTFTPIAKLPQTVSGKILDFVCELVPETL